jgi:hypothetical protein
MSHTHVTIKNVILMTRFLTLIYVYVCVVLIHIRTQTSRKFEQCIYTHFLGKNIHFTVTI